MKARTTILLFAMHAIWATAQTDCSYLVLEPGRAATSTALMLKKLGSTALRMDKNPSELSARVYLDADSVALVLTNATRVMLRTKGSNNSLYAAGANVIALLAEMPIATVVQYNRGEGKEAAVQSDLQQVIMKNAQCLLSANIDAQTLAPVPTTEPYPTYNPGAPPAAESAGLMLVQSADTRTTGLLVGVIGGAVGALLVSEEPIIGASIAGLGLLGGIVLNLGANKKEKRAGQILIEKGL